MGTMFTALCFARGKLGVDLDAIDVNRGLVVPLLIGSRKTRVNL